VLDNVRVGCHRLAHAPFLDRLLGRDHHVEMAVTSKAEGLLVEFHLSELANEPTASLPHGHQRALGIVVALASDPQLLLLDEPFTGMNPEETRQMVELVRRVRDRGVTIMLVEHDMSAVMELCEFITVMNFGQLLTEGLPDAIRKAPPASSKLTSGVPPMLLEIDNAQVYYQKVAAVKGISMHVPEGGIVTIIGANGAGKSTTLRAISGLEPLADGQIRFARERIDGLTADAIVRRGIAQVPEGRHVFPGADSRGELADRGLLSDRQSGHRARHRRYLRAFP
jgi:ABC-type branched-subunit amino acid transport system ATPase component